MAKRFLPRAALVLAMGGMCLALGSCSSVPIPPPYSEPELRAICEHHGGWWREDGLRGGYCEYQQMS